MFCYIVIINKSIGKRTGADSAGSIDRGEGRR